MRATASPTPARWPCCTRRPPARPTATPSTTGPVTASGSRAAPSPPSPPAPPHGFPFYYGARNRVWLARRPLPTLLGALYVVSFVARTLPRLRARDDVRQALRGYRDGLRGTAGERRPLRARTLWRMTRAGRPPIM